MVAFVRSPLGLLVGIVLMLIVFIALAYLDRVEKRNRADREERVAKKAVDELRNVELVARIDKLESQVESLVKQVNDAIEEINPTWSNSEDE